MELTLYVISKHSKLESQTVALSFCCRHDDLQGRERKLTSTSKMNLLRRTAHFLTALHVSLQVAQRTRQRMPMCTRAIRVQCVLNKSSASTRDRLIRRKRTSIFWLLFETGFYSRSAFIRDNTVHVADILLMIRFSVMSIIYCCVQFSVTQNSCII